MATINKYKNKGDKKFKYEYRIRYVDPITKKKKEKCKKGFTSSAEAQIAAAEAERKLRAGIEEAPISLEDYLEVWINEYKKDVVRKNTLQQHMYSINKHILPYFKKILLKDVTPLRYQKFINHLTEQGYSKRTAEIVHTTFYNACDRAIILGKIEKNPCKNVVIKGTEKKKELPFMDSDDIPKFLKTAYSYNYYYWLFFKVLIETGMRKGEAAALQWSDIDLKEKTININKTLDFAAKNKEELFGDPKTYNSKRVITISQSLANDLHFHMKIQNQNKLSLNELYHHDLNLALARTDGNFLPKSTLFNAMKRILKRAELPDMPIHALRHTHAVLLLESGAPMKYVQERLGHGSMQITADVYSHISKKIDQNAMNKFENYTKDLLN